MAFVTVMISCCSYPVFSQEKKVTLTGSLNFRSGYQWQDGTIYNYRDPWQWTIHSDPRLRIGKWIIPMNLQLGSIENKLLQPFNRFGTSPRYKWITLHAGYRNITWSPFTLGGQTFAGGGIEIQPGMLRLGFVAGNFQRSADGGFVYRANSPPSFRRPGLAARVGVGRPGNYVDLIFLRASDDTTSLVLDPAQPKPEARENVVLGSVLRQRIKKYFYLSADAAFSAITRNLFTDTVQVTDNFLGKDALLDLFHPRYSSQYATALRGRLEFRKMGHMMGAQYDRIQPDFASLGAISLLSDVERFSLEGRTTMMDQKLIVALSGSGEKNNLLSNKVSTTSRKQLNAQTQWRQSAYASYTLAYTAFLIDVDSDTPLSKSLMQSVNASANFRHNENANRWMMNAGLNTRRNQLQQTTDYTSMNVRTACELPIQLRHSITPELSYSMFSVTNSVSTHRISPGATLLLRGTDKTLSTTIGVVANLNRTGSSFSSRGLNSVAGITKIFKKVHSFNLRFVHAFTQANGFITFQQFRGDFSYSWRF